MAREGKARQNRAERGLRREVVLKVIEDDFVVSAVILRKISISGTLNLLCQKDSHDS